MTLPATEHLDLELQRGWLTLWFNQPERRNPLTAQVTAEICAVLDAVREDREVRGISFRGRGGWFCAGGDLAAFQRMDSADHAAVVAMSMDAARVFAAVDSAPQVTVALIEGAAMAGGLGLACCCDVSISTADARFAFTEARIGLTPAQIARYVLQKAGYATGRRLLLTAARLTGTEAAALGLVDQAVPDTAALEAAANELITAVLGCAPGAVAATKALVRALPATADQDIAALAAENFARAFGGAEAREGIAAFMDKRPAAWIPGETP